MNDVYLTDLQGRANKLLEDAKRFKRSLELAFSRVSNVLDKNPDEPLSVKSKCFEVCTRGPHCGRRGGAEVFDELKKMLESDDTAQVVESDCLRHCGQGPNLLLDGVLYSAMTKERVAEIVERVRSSNKLPIDMIISEENAADFLKFEEARSLLTICLRDMAGTKAALKANIEAACENLPENREERMIRMNLILEATKTERLLASAAEEVQERLASVIPLDAFVEVIFTNKISSWRKES